MPAIQLARLRQQTAALAEKLTQPGDYLRLLHDLFDFYADRTHRPGQAGTPPPLIAAYDVPMPLLRQIAVDFHAFAHDHPAAALRLSLTLWEEAALETRWLAAALLGRLPVEFAPYVLAQISEWAGEGVEDRLYTALVNLGFSRVRQEQPAALLDYARDQLAAPPLAQQRLGMGALRALAGQPGFENIPALLDTLFPFIHGRDEPASPASRPPARRKTSDR
ncbi:MAG: hypothetical protein L0Z70_12360, partial [Chloroflexi bacterium]|nr:hypothetical protein [Chloroflexota bacterium]